MLNVNIRSFVMLRVKVTLRVITECLYAVGRRTFKLFIYPIHPLKSILKSSIFLFPSRVARVSTISSLSGSLLSLVSGTFSRISRSFLSLSGNRFLCNFWGDVADAAGIAGGLDFLMNLGEFFGGRPPMSML